MAGLLQDLRFGLRMLWKNPTFTLVAVLTLGLGIGANTVIFSVVNAVVVRPLPYPQPERLVRLYTEFPTMKLEKFWISPPEYFDLVRESRSYASIGAWGSGAAALGGGERPERVPAASATHGFLPTVGVAPALGRWFGPDEDLPGDPKVVVLSHGVWQRSFGGDRNIIGRGITVEGMPVKVVGVMPAGFDFPQGAELWVPSGEDPANNRRGNHRLLVVARLRPEVTVEQARAELAVLMGRWSKSATGHRLGPPNHSMLLYPLKGEVVGSVEWMLLLLQGAVVLVLLISCANVSNLLLARAEARSREVAIRNALGARRGRLIRQFMTESLLLGALGGALGLILAFWGVDAAVSLLPEGAPRAQEIRIDGAVLAYGLTCALVTSVLFGLAPVVHARVQNLHGALKEGQRTTGAPVRQRFRRALVVGETALAVVLVIGCGLMIRSFVALSRVDLGFRADHLLTFQLRLPPKLYPDDRGAIQFLERSLERLRALPGVSGASLMTGLPPSRPLDANDLFIVGETPPQPNQGPPWNVDFWQTVGPGYFDTMGIKLLEGRLFDARDTNEAPGVVLVNETMARRFWPGRSAVGRQVRAEGNREATLQTIVGVVADVKQQGVEAPTGTELYFPMEQTPQLGFAPRYPTVVLRTVGEPLALASAVRATMAALDPQLPVARLRTMEQIMYEAVAKPRFLTMLLGVFGGLALLLAAVGIYGVMSYTVARRTHEIGIRMALGAEGSNVRRLVLRQGLLLALAGTGLGLIVALLVNRIMGKVLSGLLYDTRAVDPSTFAVVPAVVVLVAALACWIPALRATHIDPMLALRSE
jgi:putative ABC transport system permease protein